MKSINALQDVEGTEYPAGRRTRVLVGVDSPLQAEHFVQGLVVIHPNGSVPSHEHETEETYMILGGEGIMTVGEESRNVKRYDIVYIPPFAKHSLKNTCENELEMMFVYAPKMVAEHWAQERAGQLH